MKDSLINKSLITLMILLSIVGIAIADDSFSIPVSCSIPAVPGLNAPPLTEKETELSIPSKQDNEAEVMEKSSAIQENTEKEIILADGSSVTVTAKTIYSR